LVLWIVMASTYLLVDMLYTRNVVIDICSP
jgi:hypothetical protein